MFTTNKRINMIKVFLSHKSEDKGFVRLVADKLQKESIELDELSFEETQKNIDEIYRGIDESGVFVLFISQKSLQSEWCIREILRADEKLFENKLHRFIPVIIDKNIRFDNPEIPSWMRDQYNLKYISKPTVVSGIIKRALRIVTWDIHPRLKVRNIRFAGRNKQIEEFEQRYVDIDKGKPLCCIVSGLTSIGRRTFLYHVLGKTNAIKYGDVPRYLHLSKADSIESMILLLYGLGFSSIEKGEVDYLSTRSMEDKIKLAIRLFKDLDLCKDKLFIVDDFCIVDRNGDVSDWFMSIVQTLHKEISRTLICLVSQIQPNWRKLHGVHEIFAMDMPPMSRTDMVALFDILLDDEEIVLTPSDKKTVCGVFTGYPEQVKYAITLIKEESKDYLMSHLHELGDYVDQIVSRLLLRFENEGELTQQLLTLLSMTESLSMVSILDILKYDESQIKNIIKTLAQNYIIEFIGNGREFICLNDAIKCYLQREGYELNIQNKENFTQHLKNVINKEDMLEVDTSDYMLSLKEALKNGVAVDDRYLIPTHYLSAIYETYHEGKDYKLVVSLAKKILQNENYMDKKVASSVRYYLCQALSRLKNKEALIEINKMFGATHDYLLGFYYRMSCRYTDAIASYKSALKKNSKYYQAKRDLVNSYISVEDYENALDLAVELYDTYPSRPFFIQSYIRCLLHIGRYSQGTIDGLLEELHNLPNSRAQEMYMTSRALIEANRAEDLNTALNYADDAIGTYPDNIYPYLTKLEILSKTQDREAIKDMVELVEKTFDEDSSIRNKFPYLSCKCILYALNNDERNAKRYMEKYIKPLNFSKHIIGRLESSISEILHPKLR